MLAPALGSIRRLAHRLGHVFDLGQQRLAVEASLVLVVGADRAAQAFWCLDQRAPSPAREIETGAA